MGLFRSGYIVFASTTCGDAYCVNTNVPTSCLATNFIAAKWTSSNDEDRELVVSSPWVSAKSQTNPSSFNFKAPSALHLFASAESFGNPVVIHLNKIGHPGNWLLGHPETAKVGIRCDCASGGIRWNFSVRCTVTYVVHAISESLTGGIE
jgi:hypothetical protein